VIEENQPLSKPPGILNQNNFEDLLEQWFLTFLPTRTP